MLDRVFNSLHCFAKSFIICIWGITLCTDECTDLWSQNIKIVNISAHHFTREFVILLIVLNDNWRIFFSENCIYSFRWAQNWHNFLMRFSNKWMNTKKVLCQLIVSTLDVLNFLDIVILLFLKKKKTQYFLCKDSVSKIKFVPVSGYCK